MKEIICAASAPLRRPSSGKKRRLPQLGTGGTAAAGGAVSQERDLPSSVTEAATGRQRLGPTPPGRQEPERRARGRSRSGDCRWRRCDNKNVSLQGSSRQLRIMDVNSFDGQLVR